MAIIGKNKMLKKGMLQSPTDCTDIVFGHKEIFAFCLFSPISKPSLQ